MRLKPHLLGIHANLTLEQQERPNLQEVQAIVEKRDITNQIKQDTGK